MTSPYETAARLRAKYDGKPAELTPLTERDGLMLHPNQVKIADKLHTIKDVRMEFRNAVQKPAALAMGYKAGFEVKGDIYAYFRDDALLRKMAGPYRPGRDHGGAKTRCSVIMARGPFMGLSALCLKVRGKWAMVQFDDMTLPQHEWVRRRDVHLRYRRIRWDTPEKKRSSTKWSGSRTGRFTTPSGSGYGL